MINLITPLYRYNNIKLIYENICSLTNNFTWHLIEGSNKIGDDNITELLLDKRLKYYKIDTNHIWGHEQRNYFISNIGAHDDEWCYFLDDDNFITEDLIKCLDDHENDFILFSQKAGLTEQIRIYATDGRLGVGLNDIGNFLIKYKLLKQTKIYMMEYRNGDGHLGEDLKNFMKDYKFICYPDKFTRYNCLSEEIF